MAFSKLTWADVSCSVAICGAIYITIKSFKQDDHKTGDNYGGM
jgi:hypothetical protein